MAEVCEALDRLAPPHLAQEWDNVGLLIGDRSATVRRVLLTIDLTRPVVREARRRRAEMVMAYHPPIFKPIRRLTAEAAPAAWSATQAGLAVYAPHTALDAAPGGTNDVLAEAIGLEAARPLEAAPSTASCKLVVLVPAGEVSAVASAAFSAGAGRIGDYSECSFRTEGTGTFRPGGRARPRVGRTGRTETAPEVRLEVVLPRERLAAVMEAVRGAHGYETPAIDVYPLEAVGDGAGLGRIGRLARPVTVAGFIGRIKRALGVTRVLTAGPRSGRVRTAACCAGSCGGAFRSATAGGADAYVTGEMRHHDALAAGAAGMTVVCVGHSHSERPVLPRVAERLRAELPGLDAAVSEADRDPLEVV